MGSSGKEFYKKHLSYKPNRDLNDQEIGVARNTLLAIIKDMPVPGDLKREAKINREMDKQLKVVIDPRYSDADRNMALTLTGKLSALLPKPLYLNRKALRDMDFGTTQAWSFLNRLWKQGYIERHGQYTNTHYTLTEKGSARLKIGLRTFWRKENK